MIKPIIFQLPSSKVELVNQSKISFSKSDIMSQPLFKYGFHYYINQSKDKLSLLNNDNLKDKTFYNVIENFDCVIPNTEDSIEKISKKTIGIDVNRKKLQLFEILSLFSLDGNVYSNDEDYDDILGAFYKHSGLKHKIQEDPKKSDVYININEQKVDVKQLEQSQYTSIIEAIIEISEGLNKGGHCVIKIYDTFTEVSIKLLKLVSEMFEETYVYKPYMSYGRDADKYIIGIKHKDNFKNSGKLKEILTQLKTSKLNNIFNEYEIPKDFEFVCKFMNIELGNLEHKMINVLIDYVNKSNYFGDVYHSSIENQKKTTAFWKENFYASNYKKAKDNLNSLVNEVIKENNKNMNEMFKEMI